MIQKAFKYRIYPNKKQQEKIAQNFGCVRYIYNKGLETKIKTYERTGKSVSYFDLQNKMLKEEKKKNPWLKEPYSQCLQMALRNLDNAFTGFFKQKKEFPKFKKKHDSKQSCQFPQNIKIDWKLGKVYFTNIGWINVKVSRTFEG